MIDGDVPLYLICWVKVTALEHNRRFFYLFSPVAHQL